MNAPSDTIEASESTRFCEKDYDEETGLCSFLFGDGDKIEINLDELPEDIQRQLMFHGALQKIGDSYAGAKGDYAIGKAAARSVIELLQSGNWKAPRTGGGTSGPRIGELAEALARIRGYDVATAAGKVAALDDEARKALRANNRIKAAIAAFRAEKAAARLAKSTADSDAALEAL